MASDWVIAVAALVNLVIIGVLAAITKRYADETKRIAEATRVEAQASTAMAREMEQQRLSMSQPVVVPKPLEVRNVTGQHNIRLTLTNVGNGPAIGLRRTVSHPGLKVANRSTEHTQKWPILLVNEEQDMSFVLNDPVNAADGQLEVSWKDIHDQQFSLSAPMKWKESGEMELGDMNFRVVKGDG